MEWQAGLEFRLVCHSKLHLCWVNLNWKMAELQGQKPSNPHKCILWVLWGLMGPWSIFGGCIWMRWIWGDLFEDLCVLEGSWESEVSKRNPDVQKFKYCTNVYILVLKNYWYCILHGSYLKYSFCVHFVPDSTWRYTFNQIQSPKSLFT